MSTDLATILALIEAVLAAEKKFSAARTSEQEARRREKIRKACDERDLVKLRELLFEVAP